MPEESIQGLHYIYILWIIDLENNSIILTIQALVCVTHQVISFFVYSDVYVYLHIEQGSCPNLNWSLKMHVIAKCEPMESELSTCNWTTQDAC